MRSLLSTLLLALLSILPRPAAAQVTHGGDGPTILTLVDAALPAEAGDAVALARLLDVPAQPPSFVQKVGLSTLGSAFGDAFGASQGCQTPASILPGTNAAAGPCLVKGQGSFLRVQRERGKLSYVNPTRAWDPVRGVANAIPKPEAIRLVQELALRFGVPSAEIRGGRVRALDRMLAASNDDPRLPEHSVTRIEVHVRVPRQIGGVPVHGSKLIASLDGAGRVARLSATWPTFTPAATSRETVPIARAALADAIARRIEVTHGTGGSLAEVRAEIAYVDVTRLRNGAERFGDLPDVESGAPVPSFVPGIVVHAIPTEDPVGREGITLPILEIVEPLVAIAAGGRG